MASNKFSKKFQIPEFAKSIEDEIEPFSYVFPCEELNVGGQPIKFFLEIKTQVPYNDHVVISMIFSSEDTSKFIFELKLKNDFYIINYSGNKAQQCSKFVLIILAITKIKFF